MRPLLVMFHGIFDSRFDCFAVFVFGDFVARVVFLIDSFLVWELTRYFASLCALISVLVRPKLLYALFEQGPTAMLPIPNSDLLSSLV